MLICIAVWYNISIPRVHFRVYNIYSFSSTCAHLEKMKQASVVRGPYFSPGVLRYTVRKDIGD
jgi:hypothetical protein